MDKNRQQIAGQNDRIRVLLLERRQIKKRIKEIDREILSAQSIAAGIQFTLQEEQKPDNPPPGSED